MAKKIANLRNFLPIKNFFKNKKKAAYHRTNDSP